MAGVARAREATGVGIRQIRLLKRERRPGATGTALSFSTTRSPNRALQQMKVYIMNDTPLASESFKFDPSDSLAAERAFIAHLQRFIDQGRTTCWRSAPIDFGLAYGFNDKKETMEFIRGLRRAMESLLDAEVIFVEPETENLVR
jgi:hypothetical protein